MPDCILEHEKPQHARHGYERVESVDPRDSANCPGAWVDLDERPTVAERTCTIPGCSQRHMARGRCSTHYKQWLRTKPGFRRCEIAGCERPHSARGMCHTHYLKSIADNPPKTPPARRFWPKVLWVQSDCWEWAGSRNRFGYGKFSASGAERSRLAHQYAYEMLVGPVPVGMELDHLCRNPACVNPRHLEPVTHTENVRRGVLARSNGLCVNGHPWVPDYSLAPYLRRCKACHRENERRARADGRR